MTSTKHGNQTPEKGWRRKCKESTRKSSKTRTTHHGKTQMESQSPACFRPVNRAHAGLNIGGGAEAKLRSRRPNNEWHFFPYEQILDTMSHELCHNKNVGELMAKGITGTGQGFDLPGRCLGGFSRQPPLSSLRPSALAATENRARRDALLPSGPKRSGGDSNIKAPLSPTQASAMAAERRLHDDLWHESKSSDSVTSIEGIVGHPAGSSISASSKVYLPKLHP
uniref:WLM domain-containing protein n=1 Tax=Salix viminalis TaxID=40686 RepID=A0A6N2LBX6_SALVM